MSALHREIAACRICEPHLADGVRPVVQFSDTPQILIIGQAPGSKVHASGIPWDDDSGDRLRAWTGLTKDQFYDPGKVALVPMGFCYPGKASGGDRPPRKECAPQWHDRVLQTLPKDRLTLLVGTYAQAYYLPETRKLSLTERVKRYEEFLPRTLPLPHPAWRSRIWMGKNPWFEADILPVLRKRISDLLN
ncbi:uracil-DNA glycosylase family protein [Pontixanthobacter aestiaquae]|uniref:Uracil-DNA glycosylase family protein n=1 Tax=Pontixanthobacter aestiaquae TaxID=1509367 RepID=A0A844Z5Q8_9SPHN|nr:uracil-DNA glycosylase family protein [Pontixanthobacter aestiaquae]MDN3645750.1 uracil-DNA glycosylase family protein [Pontixanthobacter aestiaquae]MXO83255.1 uracil-DNA glycosylase family protein [Pontixanthobacter aestiaquae]